MNLWRERAASGLEWFRGPRGLWATGIVVVLLVVLWLTPRRVARLVTVDGKDIGPAPAGSPTWQVGWEPAGPIEVEAADGGESVDLIAPRLVSEGQLLFLTRRGPDGQMDIFRSQLNEGSWSRAVPVAEINSGANDIGPVVSSDGLTLYFFSNRAGGHGGYDLYVSRRRGSTWTPPKNLGDAINSPANEFDPALAPDGLDLFFASDRSGADPDRTGPV